jgi:hypothetical protein
LEVKPAEGHRRISKFESMDLMVEVPPFLLDKKTHASLAIFPTRSLLFRIAADSILTRRAYEQTLGKDVWPNMRLVVHGAGGQKRPQLRERS